jgi:hypothetical protein
VKQIVDLHNDRFGQRQICCLRKRLTLLFKISIRLSNLQEIATEFVPFEGIR